MNSFYSALTNLMQIYADYISSYDINIDNIATISTAIITNLSVTNGIIYPITHLWNNLINQSSSLLGINQLSSTNFINNITQSSGSSQFNDCQIANITQPNGVIIQNSTTNWNLLKKTQITNLEVLSSLVLPPNITIAGSSYTSDLILNNATIQQINSYGINTFQSTDFYNGNVRFSNNISMIGGSLTTSLLKNLTVVGTCVLESITSPTITSILSSILLKADINNPTFTGTVSGITKAMINLANVDNVSDINKPISTAVQTALNLKTNTSYNPNFTIGTVTTTTGSPTVILTGTNPNMILNFGLQQGIQGIQGVQGIQGITGVTPSISIGTVTQGVSPIVTITGTTIAPILNFTLQKGDTGSQGVQGSTGGKGATGDTGAQGPAGSNGIDGSAVTGIAAIAAVTALTASVAISVATLQAEITANTIAITAVVGDVTILQSQMVSTGIELGTLSTEVDNLTLNYATLQARVLACESRITAVETMTGMGNPFSQF